MQKDGGMLKGGPCGSVLCSATQGNRKDVQRPAREDEIVGYVLVICGGRVPVIREKKVMYNISTEVSFLSRHTGTNRLP